jgi:hypothetical protein
MNRPASLLTVALLPLASLPAQGVSTPFRQGQWATQFGGGLNLATLGVLRFTGPRAAWVLDLRAALSTSFTVLLGRRFFQDRDAEIVTFQTIGVSSGYLRSRAQRSGGEVTQRIWAVGLLGELGAAYFLTRKFSLGAFATATASYSSVSSKTPTTEYRAKEYAVQLQGLRFVMTVYF